MTGFMSIKQILRKEEILQFQMCRNGFNVIQSQLLHSSFKLIISFTYSSLMFKSLGSEQLDKFSEVLIEFYLYLFKALQKIRRQRITGSQIKG